MTVSATSSNTTLSPNGSLILTPGVGGNWTITATPVGNLNGTATITVAVNDGTTTINETFDVTVTAVNDAPSGSDSELGLTSGISRTLAANAFGFSDPIDGDRFAAVIITTIPSEGTLTLNGIQVTNGQTVTVTVTDIAAGQLRYTAATSTSGITPPSLIFQVH